MSYILDALKKAEEERRRGTVPDIMAAQDVRPLKGRSARVAWAYVLLAALLLNAGVLAWWAPWSPERQGKAVQKAAVEKKAVPAETVGHAPDPGAATVSLPAEKAEPGPEEKAVADSGSERTLLPGDSDKGKTTRYRPEASTAAKGSAADRPETPAPVKEDGVEAGAVPPPVPNRIYTVGQLPSSVRQDLPEMSMSLHYFTEDPSSCLIRINGETLREGEEMMPGLRLEKITPAGAIFDYRHYRFRIGLQSG